MNNISRHLFLIGYLCTALCAIKPLVVGQDKPDKLPSLDKKTYHPTTLEIPGEIAEAPLSTRKEPSGQKDKEEHKASDMVHIHMINRGETTDERIGYDFYVADGEKNSTITTNTPDKSHWINDGDEESQFFNSEPAVRSAHTTYFEKNEDRLIGRPKLDISLSENPKYPLPLTILSAHSKAIQTIIKSFDGQIIKTNTEDKQKNWPHLPPGFVPIPNLPTYYPMNWKK